MIARVALALLFLIAPAAAKGLSHGHGGTATSIPGNTVMYNGQPVTYGGQFVVYP